MVALCLSASAIFFIPFISEIYYVPMQNAFHFNNTQMGMLMSIFGATSMLAYFPGGWLADKFSPRRLMSVALLICGGAGFYFAALPSYFICLVIYGLWGACISLVFWSAMIKATREWAPSDEQGRAFGILESGRGAGDVLTGTIVGAVFIWLGSDVFAFTQVVNLLAATCILFAVIVWFALEKRAVNYTDQEKNKVNLHDIIEVIKIPEVWLIAIVILASYTCYWGGFYFAKFATDAFAMGIAMGVVIGTAKTWINPIAPLIAGFLGDKIGISRSVFSLLALMVVSFFILGIMPYGPNYLTVMLLTMAVTAFGLYALRGIYFALFEEGGIPLKITGTAAGIVSVIGFMPDIFMPYIGGVIFDAYPDEQGYRYLFFIVSAICVIGATAAYIILRRSMKREAL
jgi:MFS family permease